VTQLTLLAPGEPAPRDRELSIQAIREQLRLEGTSEGLTLAIDVMLALPEFSATEESVVLRTTMLGPLLPLLPFTSADRADDLWRMAVYSQRLACDLIPRVLTALGEPYAGFVLRNNEEAPVLPLDAWCREHAGALIDLLVVPTAPRECWSLAWPGGRHLGRELEHLVKLLRSLPNTDRHGGTLWQLFAWCWAVVKLLPGGNRPDGVSFGRENVRQSFRALETTAGRSRGRS